MAARPVYERRVILTTVLAALALLSLALTFWQWPVARVFPAPRAADPFPPGVTLLKPLKDATPRPRIACGAGSRRIIPAAIQMLFGVAAADDPVANLSEADRENSRSRRATHRVRPRLPGQRQGLDRWPAWNSSPGTTCSSSATPMSGCRPIARATSCSRSAKSEVGLVNCFYRLANPINPGDAVGSRRHQRRFLEPGAAVQKPQTARLRPRRGHGDAPPATPGNRRVRALADCLADDYQLGNRIARLGYKIALCPVVVECWSAPMGWKACGSINCAGRGRFGCASRGRISSAS